MSSGRNGEMAQMPLPQMSCVSAAICKAAQGRLIVVNPMRSFGTSDHDSQPIGITPVSSAVAGRRADGLRHRRKSVKRSPRGHTIEVGVVSPLVAQQPTRRRILIVGEDDGRGGGRRRLGGSDDAEGTRAQS